VLAPPGLAPAGLFGEPGGTGPGIGGAVGEPAGIVCATAIPPVMSPTTMPATAAKRVNIMRTVTLARSRANGLVRD
jgi:hypothetical protein